MKVDYPVKILVAWGEAIGGNGKIRNWLMKNGFPELGLFTYALMLKDDARKWLLENGFPHLMAFCAACEGDQKALQWLKLNNFDLFVKMALYVDAGDVVSGKWLKQHNPVLAVLAGKIKAVKDQIQRDNDDIHKISAE